MSTSREDKEFCNDLYSCGDGSGRFNWNEFELYKLKRSLSCSKLNSIGSESDLKDSIHSLITRPLTSIDRLYYERKNRIDILRRNTKVPNGSIPDGKLPGWIKLRTGDKIPAPILPNHKLVFTRGKISQNLLKSFDSFKVNIGKNDLISSECYNALHDPYASSYFDNPKVQQHLISQGLLTPQGEVVCSLKEFNNWRLHLDNVVQVQKINNSLHKAIATYTTNIQQLKRFREFEEKGSRFKIQNPQMENRNKATKLKKIREYQDIERYKEKQQLKEEQIQRWKIYKKQNQLKRILQGVEEEENKIEKSLLLQDHIAYRRSQTILKIKEKEKEAQFRKEMKYQIEIGKKERKYMDYLHVQCAFQEAENEREGIVEEFFKNESKKGATQRQKRIEKRRKNFRNIFEENKKKKEREEYLVRKYIEKWINLTIDGKLKGKSNLIPPTVFSLPSELGYTLEYLIKNTNKMESKSKQNSTQLIPIPIPQINQHKNNIKIHKNKPNQIQITKGEQWIGIGMKKEIHCYSESVKMDNKVKEGYEYDESIQIKNGIGDCWDI